MSVAAGSAVYGVMLWLIATVVSRRRGLDLGAFPVAALSLSGIGAGVLSTVEGPQRGALTAAAMIGAIVCGLVDARTGYIFDALTAGVAATGLAATAAVAGATGSGLAGAALVGSAMVALHVATRGAGLGLGDVKLAAALAVACGAGMTFRILATAFVCGACYGGFLIVTRRATRGAAIRFGPFIAAGTVIATAADAIGVVP